MGSASIGSMPSGATHLPSTWRNQHAISMQSVCNQYAISMQPVCSQYAIRSRAPAVDLAHAQPRRGQPLKGLGARRTFRVDRGQVLGDLP